MNNQQFRRLVLDADSIATKNGAATTQQGGDNTSALGSRPQASISMTPRRIGGSSTTSNMFVRQKGEQKFQQSVQEQKKFRSLEAPRGTKLAAGYTDRAQQLREEALNGPAEGTAGDSAPERVKALEEMKKLGQIDQTTFESLRDQITGGDLRNAHLIKGLDRQLLARARAGEDVYNTSPAAETSREVLGSPHIEEELDDLVDHTIAPIEREKKEKHGKTTDVPLTGKKRRRDDILRDFKESRAKIASEQKLTQPKLGAHFKKITRSNQPGTSRVETDELGREILIVVDAEGKLKRKIKKQRSHDIATGGHTLPMPLASAKPLGMEVPANPKANFKDESTSEDIFADAGTDYDPLGVEEEDSGSLKSDEEDEGRDRQSSCQKMTSKTEESASGYGYLRRAFNHETELGTRNYFAGMSDDKSSNGAPATNSLSEPSFTATVQRASLHQAARNEGNNIDGHGRSRGPEQDLRARIRARLADGDRDEDDIDMGFGSSRFADQEEDEERSVKLSNWEGLGAEAGKTEQGGWQNRGGQKQRKRGKKKANGNKNDARAVLGVLEKRRNG